VALIPPVLTAAEWSAARMGDGTLAAALARREPLKAIAILNDQLEASEPRKITYEKIAELRTQIAIVESDRGTKQVNATAIVDALETLLPPVGF
jgi:hypothetical protein